MSIYNNNSIQGELWLRDLRETVRPANQVLSSIYLKYKNIYPSFYDELNSNQIVKFDMFYDTIFIETNSGCVFEKFYLDDGYIKPFNQLNFFNIRKDTRVDYWFDETKNKIYFADIFINKVRPVEEFLGSGNFDFIVTFRVFDCTTGLAKNIFIDLIKLYHTDSINWDDFDFNIEDPKLTYNVDTKHFNLSFAIKNYKDELGLLSLNILGGDNPRITELNGFLPYVEISSLTSGITSIKKLPDDIATNYLAYTDDKLLLKTEFGELLGWDI